MGLHIAPPTLLSFILTVAHFPRYRLVTPTKAVQWSVEWSAVDDSRLLVGVYEHGIGNWDAIKGDSKLGLGAKVLLYSGAQNGSPLPTTLMTLVLSPSCEPSAQILSSDRSRKPQSSHLLTRVEYLLKLLQKEFAASKQKVGVWGLRCVCVVDTPHVASLVGLCRVAGKGKPFWRSSRQWPSDANHPEWQLPVVGRAGGGALPSAKPKRAVRVRTMKWTRTSSHLL